MPLERQDCLEKWLIPGAGKVPGESGASYSSELGSAQRIMRHIKRGFHWSNAEQIEGQNK